MEKFRYFYDRLYKALHKQSGRNAIFSAASVVANPVLALVSTPYLFKRLGAENYGTWALINAVLAVSGVASLGLGDAATKFVALHHARSDSARVIKVIQSVLTLYLGLGLLAGALMWIFAPWLIVYAFKTSVEHRPYTVLSLRIASIGFVIRFIYGVLEATVRGYHRYDLESMWSVFNTVVSTLVAVACVWFGQGLNGVLLGGIVVLVIGTFGLANVARRLIGQWAFFRLSLDRDAMKEVFGFGIFTWFQALNGIVLHQLDRIVIGASLGATIVGYYAVCLQLVQTAHMVLTRACAFLFPLVVKYREEGRSDELWKIFKRGMILTTMGGWIFSGGLFIFGGFFLTHWMGPTFAAKATVTLQILAVWNACLATTIVPFYFLNATGQERLNAVFGMFSSGAFVCAAIFLIPMAGVEGAAWARLASISTGLVSRAILFRRVFGDRRWYTGILPLIPVGAAVGLAMLLWHFQVLSFLPPFLVMVFVFGVTLAVSGGTSWYVYQKLFGAKK